MIIKSEWKYEKADWDNVNGRFVNKTISEIFIKDIEIKVYKDIITGRELVKFIGGPTGWETYRLEDLKEHDLDNYDRFCICAGTINSWANCTVSSRDIHKAIEAYEESMK
jgi:hypothetical protein